MKSLVAYEIFSSSDEEEEKNEEEDIEVIEDVEATVDLILQRLINRVCILVPFPRAFFKFDTKGYRDTTDAESGTDESSAESDNDSDVEEIEIIETPKKKKTKKKSSSESDEDSDSMFRE